jgi:hypothetical protein
LPLQLLARLKRLEEEVALERAHTSLYKRRADALAKEQDGMERELAEDLRLQQIEREEQQVDDATSPHTTPPHTHTHRQHTHSHGASSWSLPAAPQKLLEDQLILQKDHEERRPGTTLEPEMPSKTRAWRCISCPRSQAPAPPERPA